MSINLDNYGIAGFVKFGDCQNFEIVWFRFWSMNAANQSSVLTKNGGLILKPLPLDFCKRLQTLSLIVLSSEGYLSLIFLFLWWGYWWGQDFKPKRKGLRIVLKSLFLLMATPAGFEPALPA